MKLVITARDYSTTGKEAMELLYRSGFEIENIVKLLDGSIDPKYILV